jgi:dihydrodipicolinate synthase/N-acetylneuraminate lyase
VSIAAPDKKFCGESKKMTSNLDRRMFMAGLSATFAIRRETAHAMTRREPRALSGVFPIGFTPTTPADAIDFDGLASQVEFCKRGGVHGIAWPQIASGWTTLTEYDRLKGAEIMVDVAKGSSTAVVIGVQSRDKDLAETTRYARHAEKIGAHALICIVQEGMPPDAQLEFFKQLGNTTTLPLFAQTIGDLTVDRLVALAEAVPSLQYVKDEAGDPLKRVAEINRRTSGRLKCFSGRGVSTMITELERGFVGHCPFTSLADLYATAFDLYRSGKRREAFDQFGRIQAASSMFAQSSVNVLIARGVLKPGTRIRLAPEVATSLNAIHAPLSTPDEIKRALDTYLAPYLRA